jgi:hypothetical protein
MLSRSGFVFDTDIQERMQQLHEGVCNAQSVSCVRRLCYFFYFNPFQKLFFTNEWLRKLFVWNNAIVGACDVPPLSKGGQF